MRLHSRCRFLDSNPVVSYHQLCLAPAPTPAPNGNRILLHPNETVSSSRGPSLGWPMTGIHAPLDGPIGRVVGLDLLDRELWHHHKNVTCFSLSSVPSKQQIRQIAVSREAVSHQFLSHALLSRAAVNLIYLHPTKRHFYLRESSVQSPEPGSLDIHIRS